MQDDRRLERLHFGELFRDRQVIQREAEQQQEDDVLQGRQPLVHAVADLQLAHAQALGDAVGEFLQGAERAQPAAERTPVPEHHGDRGGAPQDEHQRVHQEVLPAEIRAQGREERQHVDDGQLRLAVPADPEQRERQERQAQPVVQEGAGGKLVLEEEDADQHRQRNGQDGDLASLALPDLLPQGRRGVGLGRGRLGSLLRGSGSGRDGAGIGARKLIGKIERDEGLVRDAEHALDHELQAPGLDRIQRGVLGHDKQRNLAQRRGARRIDVRQALVVAVPEAEAAFVLNDLDAVENAAADVAGALERIGAVASDQHRLLARLEPGA
ncbi:hypothetical protein D3C72_1432980 [compost metagenome]